MMEVTIKKQMGSFRLDVNFIVDELSIGILGSSGCGKSVTLKCIAGLITPDEGRIVVNGKVLFDSKQHINMSPQNRKIGYFFQNYALFPHMNVEKNIRIVNPAMSNEDIITLLKRFHVYELREKFPGQLSGGQQQRVALARLIASEPEVLLFDEPFSALDTYLKEEVELEVKQFLMHYQKQSILVSHSRDELYHLCDYLLVMQQGQICEQAMTKRLFHETKTMYAARLSGCKNIVKVERQDAHHLFIPDWNHTCTFSKPIPNTITHIGIRAHDWFLSEPNSSLLSIMVCMDSIIEHPFDFDIILECYDTKHHLWWKRQEQLIISQEPFLLSVKIENILLLEE